MRYKRVKTEQTKESKLKSQFRQTARWKKFRAFKKKECAGVDLITGKKLLKGFQLHHKDMSLENYKTLTPEKFICLNKTTHEVVHWLFKYYQKDNQILDRLKILLDQMVLYNTDSINKSLEEEKSHDKESL